MAEKPVHFIQLEIETSIEEIVIIVFCTLITQIKLSAHELAHQSKTHTTQYETIIGFSQPFIWACYTQIVYYEEYWKLLCFIWRKFHFHDFTGPIATFSGRIRETNAVWKMLRKWIQIEDYFSLYFRHLKHFMRSGWSLDCYVLLFFSTYIVNNWYKSEIHAIRMHRFNFIFSVIHD